MKFDYGPALIAAGMLVGLRVTVSMVVGGLVQVLVLGPIGLGYAWTNAVGKVVTAVSKPASAWKDIGVWWGAPLLVSSGILAFAFQWRTIVRAFRGFAGGGSSAGGAPCRRPETPEHVEACSNTWFAVGAGAPRAPASS